MKRLLQCLIACATIVVWAGSVGAAEAAAPAPAPALESSSAASAEAEKQRTAIAAAVALQQQRGEEGPDFLEHVVDSVLGLFNVESSGNTPVHYGISGLLFVIALLARRIVTRMIFPILRKLAAKTQTTLDDKLFPALETPVAALIMVFGLLASLKVLKLPLDSDVYLNKGSRFAFSIVIFWGLWRALGAILTHAQEAAQARSMGIAAFMPWIKKTVLSVFVVIGVLLILQSLNYDVKAILAGLGIGSLAVALAAQDSLANIFGAIVVAIDQPFKIGETVKIGANVGGVEDIGLRSTRIRLVDKSLMVIPNKTVAAEPITNLSRFTRRRVEQVIGLTYDTTPAQMTQILEDIKTIVTAQPEVDAAGVMVFFRDFSASSLDIWIVYELPDPDFQKHSRVKERINLEIMRAVEARGLEFAFPTQTVHLAGEVATRRVEREAPESRA